MKRLITAAERSISYWAGGSSSQICIWPPQAQYSQRDFLYRISTAVADSEDWSPYTALPGVTRWLLMLDGSAVVEHEGCAKYMEPYGSVDVFDGGVDSRAKGRVRDFNLMCRGGTHGSVELPEDGASLRATGGHRLLFCAEGDVFICFPEKEYHLQKEDALWMSEAEAASIRYGGKNSRLLCCEMQLP